MKFQIYNPNNGMISVLVSNHGDNVWKEMSELTFDLYSKPIKGHLTV